jgi:integrase/recombinase XerD
MTAAGLGPILHAFFVDHLTRQKGLRRSSVQSYRDAVRLLLAFVASDKRCKLSGIEIEDLTFDRVQRFLRQLEDGRGNRVPTRNQRLAALRTFFEYVGSRAPEMFGTCQQIAAIPTKRTPPPATQFLERDEIAALFARLPSAGRHTVRDRALLLFLYNTGARVQEAADLRVEHIDLERGPRARLYGKGGKWRTCPLWDETARLLRQLMGDSPVAQAPVFCSATGKPFTRFGIYKLVRRHTARLQDGGSAARRIGPHVFRHTTAVHLLEAGVEVNVIRGWLGHVNLATTNRYADINIRTKEAALRQCAPPPGVGGPKARAPVWRNDETMLAWLASL